MSVLSPVLLLMGPTASGKSDLAVRLAERLDGEIVSVDSAMVYRGMDIGTAKPTLAQRRGIVHHLIDILDPAEAFSTGMFRDAVLALVGEIRGRGRLPILAGGTMLYFNALLRGLAALPAADPALRRELEDWGEREGQAALHERLRQVDPVSAARIHPNDPQRTQRALEVFLLTGKPLTELWAAEHAPPLPFRPVKVVVAPADRSELHRRIAQRFHAMLESGLVEEVERLYRRGDLDVSLPSIRAVGYRQVWGYLSGEHGWDVMVEKGIAATRQLAKRQFTWLRREDDALWRDSEPAESLAERLLRDLAPLL
ncbi:tRNA (adenosine(37)-N6)-dimethylallyltransferase MiaA [Methylogaea oryzae]|uniref:tRNA dimethylallyltransferase n=1 Tax=Methylogaea oryzae TaxID=1295382 RepID=A0A8D4VSD9_9GAMM|nr:tRNA (adenosine(37)-N6)-dimethylallyltransferase MiaA [Methylogaea oryzae]BBL71674.1 tRNA dimethylallyltransferase [Methylogaea oryzae]